MPLRLDDTSARAAGDAPRRGEERPLSTPSPAPPRCFNSAPSAQVLTALTACCASPRWAAELAAGRPFPSVDAVLERADHVLAGLGEPDIDAALAGHPRIGERSGHASSCREQAGVTGADAGVLAALAAGNRAYELRFGYVYLVCADGRSAEELLTVLRTRLGHDPETERGVLRTELGKINRLRLTRLLADR